MPEFNLFAVGGPGEGERVELGHSSFSAFLHSPSRRVRKEAFHTYYKQYEAHEHDCGVAERLGATRCVLRQGPELPNGWKRPSLATGFPTCL